MIKFDLQYTKDFVKDRAFSSLEIIDFGYFLILKLLIIILNVFRLVTDFYIELPEVILLTLK